MTNYEKITSMSIKELVKFLEDIDCANLQPWHFYYFDHYCTECPYKDSDECEEIEYDSQHGCDIGEEVNSIISEWLKAEVESKIENEEN